MKVLFADDEIHLQELIAAELPRMGHTVTVCPDGLTAVAAIEKDTFDCIIVDLDMPCLLYTSPSPRDQRGSRMPSSA